ncbi:HAAS signaling domain-containing protein [Longispora albida]|uniref:HAAS signaling domain-containing protein n=1 Tax=Longispora albida TaxID=203523 RepID=UPI000371B45B|nr:hypothetical protein [Longispora albida]
MTNLGTDSQPAVNRAMEASAYLAGVRAALADLPAALREDLLEELPGHLAEVQAEGAGSLVERLGSPVAYAAELRASAGLPPGPVPSAPSTVDYRELARRCDEAAGRLAGYEKGSDLLRDLLPGWWVLRGVFATVLLMATIGLHWYLGLVTVPLAVVMAMVSVRIGRASRTWPLPAKMIMIGLNGLLSLPYAASLLSRLS